MYERIYIYLILMIHLFSTFKQFWHDKHESSFNIYCISGKKYFLNSYFICISIRKCHLTWECTPVFRKIRGSNWVGQMGLFLRNYWVSSIETLQDCRWDYMLSNRYRFSISSSFLLLHLHFPLHFSPISFSFIKHILAE